MNHGTVAGNSQAYGLRFSSVSTVFATRVVMEHEKLTKQLSDAAAQMSQSTHIGSNGKLRGLIDLAESRIATLMAFIEDHRNMYGPEADADRIHKILEAVERLDAAMSRAREASSSQPYAHAHEPHVPASPARRAEQMGVSWEAKPSHYHGRSSVGALSPPLPDHRRSPDPARRRDGRPSGFLRDHVADDESMARLSAVTNRPGPRREAAPDRDYDDVPVGGGGGGNRLQRTPPRARSRELTLDDEPAPRAFDDVPVGGGGGRFDEPQPAGFGGSSGGGVRRGEALQRDSPPRRAQPAKQTDVRARLEARRAGGAAADNKPRPKADIRARLEARRAGGAAADPKAVWLEPRRPGGNAGPGKGAQAEPEVTVAAPRGGPRGPAEPRHVEEPRSRHDEDDVAIAPPVRHSGELRPGGTSEREEPSARAPRAAAGSRANSSQQAPPWQRGAAASRSGPSSSSGGFGSTAAAAAPPSASTIEGIIAREESARMAIVCDARDAMFRLLHVALADSAFYSQRAEVAGTNARAPRRTVNASREEYQAWSFVIVAPIIALVAAFLLLPILSSLRKLTGA